MLEKLTPKPRGALYHTNYCIFIQYKINFLFFLSNDDYMT